MESLCNSLTKYTYFYFKCNFPDGPICPSLVGWLVIISKKDGSYTSMLLSGILIFQDPMFKLTEHYRSLQRKLKANWKVRSITHTGCSLNIVFFFEDSKTFRTLAFLCFSSVSVCVHTSGRQTSAAAELAEGKNTVINEHPADINMQMQYLMGYRGAQGLKEGMTELECQKRKRLQRCFSWLIWGRGGG